MGSRERAVFHIGNHIAVRYAPLKTVDDMNAAGDTVVRVLESANLTIVPANLLDAVIAAVEMTEIPWKESQEWRKKEIIAAIRAAWEGVTDGD
jgi:hypothetical protein